MKNFKKKFIVYWPKKMHFIWVLMYLAEKYYLGTLFLHGGEEEGGMKKMWL